MSDNNHVESFIAEWAPTGGSELANTQSFVNGLCTLIGVDPPKGSRPDDSHNDYVFERRVFQKEADGTESFGRIDAYKRHCFIVADIVGKLDEWTYSWQHTADGRGRRYQPQSGFRGSIELIGWDALLGDARARNQAFFDRAGISGKSYFSPD